MDYTVISQNSLDELIKDVRELLNQGWKCQGGVNNLTQGTYKVFYQAMVK